MVNCDFNPNNCKSQCASIRRLRADLRKRLCLGRYNLALQGSLDLPTYLLPHLGAFVQCTTCTIIYSGPENCYNGGRCQVWWACSGRKDWVLLGEWHLSKLNEGESIRLHPKTQRSERTWEVRGIVDIPAGWYIWICCFEEKNVNARYIYNLSR